MLITKLDERVVRPVAESYFATYRYTYSIQTKYKKSRTTSSKVLEEFIRSNFFLWQEEFRNNVVVNINGSKSTVDWNFHGLYDASKISVSDFDKVTFEIFMSRLFSFIVDKIGEDKTLPQIYQTIIDTCQVDSDFYVINDLPKSKVHPWTVYDFFISGIAINIDKMTITRVEFGRD